MMKPKWIVENLTREESYLELVTALKNENYDLLELNEDFKYKSLDKYTDEYPVIFMGSINISTMVNAYLSKCYPVTFNNHEKYLCSKYMSYFGSYLFNDKYAIIALSDLYRNKEFFYSTFGTDGFLFVRPDSGQKTFQAKLIELTDFDRFYNNYIDLKHDLVVISSPKNILGEYRFVVSSNKNIIAHSTYREHDIRILSSNVPIKAIELVNSLLKIEYFPDVIFIMDICKASDDNFYLLELNTFSSAGLYACDKYKIVNEVSLIVEKEWNEWKV